MNAYRKDYDALDMVYKKLQEDKQVADISEIIKKLHDVVDAAIETRELGAQDGTVYDISKIDFDKLKSEFQKSALKNTAVQELKTVIENRLKRLLAENPLRADFQAHYEEIVAAYNSEKDRAIIEKTFEVLLKFIAELDEEESRAVREGLDKESLALFDLLKKDDLTANDIKRIKNVAVELLETLKAERLRVDQWRDKESSRDAVRVTIKDFLWNDTIGLPAPAYSDLDVEIRTDAVFKHIFHAYPRLPSPIYAS